MSNTLVPVYFQGTPILVAEYAGKKWVALRPIVEALELSWSGQIERLKRDAILSTCVRVTRTQLPNDKQARQVVFLDVDYLNGWLFGIDANRVKPELKDKIVAYQRYCYKVLARHFDHEKTLQDQIKQKRLIDEIAKNKIAEKAYFSRYPKDKQIREMATVGYAYWYIAEKIPCHINTVSRAIKRMSFWGFVEKQRLLRAKKDMRTFNRTLRLHRQQTTFDF
jgi:hypothetical protein